MIEAIGIGVFAFVAISVGGWRALDWLESRENAPVVRAVHHYSGPRFNAHGREIL